MYYTNISISLHRLVPKRHKELLQFKIVGKDLNSHFTKEDELMAKKKKHAQLHVISSHQGRPIKTTDISLHTDRIG